MRHRSRIDRTTGSTRRGARGLGILASALLFGWIAALPTLASDEPSGQPQASTMARPIERALPSYPADAAAEGHEGWVVLSYVIAEDGSVGDVLVEVSSGVPSFERAAQRAAQSWRFEPATLDGKPTQQCHTRILLPFEIDRSKRAARGKVKRGYQRAIRALDKGDVDEARELIAEMREKIDVNLYEGARLSFLESLIARELGDVEGEREHLWWALIGGGRYIEDELATAAWQRLFVLDVKTRRFAAALGRYERMQESLGDDEIPEWVTSKVAELRALSERDGRFAVSGRIPEPRSADEEHGVWAHEMLFRTVGFQSESIDALEEFDLRCDFHRAKGRPRADRATRVPDAWGSCWIFVSGKPGTEFKLVEYSGTP